MKNAITKHHTNIIKTSLQNEQKASRLTKTELAEELIYYIWADYCIESYESALLERAVKELQKKEIDDQRLARLQQIEWAVEWFVECVEAGQYLQEKMEKESNVFDLILGLDPISSGRNEFKKIYKQAWQDVLKALS